LLFSLSGSEGIAALLAAKIIGIAVQSHCHSLPAGHKFFADRILLKGVARRHLMLRLLLRAPRGRDLSPAGREQAVSDVDENDNDDDA